MSWTTPKSWGYKETLSSSDMNTHVRDNLNALRDGSGIATDAIDMTKITNPYKTSVYLGSNQSMTQGTWSTINLNTENYDINSNFDTATYTYTVPVTGYYLISANVRINNAAILRGLSVRLLIDGTTGRSENMTFDDNWTADHISKTISEIIYFTAGQTVKLQAYPLTSGANATAIASAPYTYISIHLLSTE